jgi:putative acetyltransferase
MKGLDDALTIRQDDLSGREIAKLLGHHLNAAIESSPEGAVHALHLDDLRQPDITVWSAWIGEELAGCGALRELTKAHGELKSMRTATSHLRTGVGAAVLAHMMKVARDRGYERLSLETGKTDDFAPARAFYTKFSFLRCPAFADYVDDGFSVFMTRLV